MIKPEEVHLLVESVTQHSGTNVPPDAALAALYALAQYRYRARCCLSNRSFVTAITAAADATTTIHTQTRAAGPNGRAPHRALRGAARNGRAQLVPPSQG